VYQSVEKARFYFIGSRTRKDVDTAVDISCVVDVSDGDGDCCIVELLMS